MLRVSEEAQRPKTSEVAVCRSLVLRVAQCPKTSELSCGPRPSAVLRSWLVLQWPHLPLSQTKKSILFPTLRLAALVERLVLHLPLSQTNKKILFSTLRLAALVEGP